MSVREHYQGAIGRVLCKLGIAPPTFRQPIIFHRDTELATALRYTAWYCHRVDSVKHYRNKLYFDTLRQLRPAGSKLSHIDISCGTGPFSWAFLDWATSNNSFNYRQVGLYGIDRSPAMILAARMIRDELANTLPEYPLLHYYHDAKSLLSDFRKTRHPNADSIITLGHILVQSHTSDDIRDITEIIVQVRKLTDPTRQCLLATVDAWTRTDALREGWDLLLQSLRDSDTPCTPWAMPKTYFNNPNNVKLATL